MTPMKQLKCTKCAFQLSSSGGISVAPRLGTQTSSERLRPLGAANPAMVTTLDHYQLLGLSEKRNGSSISTEELRQAYKRALLSYHPDKHTPGTLHSSERTTVTVDEIAQAYKVLGDPALRAQYDQELAKAGLGDAPGISTRHTGMEVVDLEELDADDDGAVWRRPCRCGSEPAFIVTEAELEKNVEFGELITGCKGCSLWLKVMFTVED
ncbi:hypothetical protein BST61_g9862 [Cercospora zeina]